MVNAPHVSLKVIVGVHFILSVWASMLEGFLPTAYIYMNAFILAFGVWGIIAPDSVDSIFMFMNLHVISFVMDIIFLIAFHPQAHQFYEHGAGRFLALHLTSIIMDVIFLCLFTNNPKSHPYVSTYRFCLGMAIVNLLIKPLSSFVLYRLHQDRGGAYGDFGIPGMPNFGVSGSNTGAGYENIDQPIPSNSMDSGSPDHLMDKSPLP